MAFKKKNSVGVTALIIIGLLAVVGAIYKFFFAKKKLVGSIELTPPIVAGHMGDGFDPLNNTTPSGIIAGDTNPLYTKPELNVGIVIPGIKPHVSPVPLPPITPIKNLDINNIQIQTNDQGTPILNPIFLTGMPDIKNYSIGSPYYVFQSGYSPYASLQAKIDYQAARLRAVIPAAQLQGSLLT